jgi:hypothetical protein
MQQLGTYDVRADSQLMAVLELRVHEMKNENWRNVALDNLKELRK